MSQNNDSDNPDYDFATGFIFVIFAYVGAVWNLAVAFVTKEPISILVATMMFFWFLFAPVYVSKMLSIEQWTLSKYGNSIFSTMKWRDYKKKHPEAFH